MTDNMPAKMAGSFRDPSGQVFSRDGEIVRSIRPIYQPHWRRATESGLLARLLETRAVVSFTEIEPWDDSWKALSVEKIPCVTYPYEWSFSQLRDAALLTLDIQKEALSRGMALKDASAYNVQFLGARPLFIDLLSFENRGENEPWQAYRQFCMHFLAPLALYGHEPRLGRMSRLWIDGLPLDLAWDLLPKKSFFSLGLQLHLHLHARAERKYQDGRKAAAENIKAVKISTRSLVDLADSLKRTVAALKPAAMPGEWTDYYQDTNYDSAAEQSKHEIVERAVQAGGDLAMDLGANTGRYSQVLAKFFKQVIAADIDPQAVDIHYRRLAAAGDATIVPLVLDLANPSPGIGWACAERAPWADRWAADCVCALALTHHLFFTNGIPWPEQALFFSKMLRPGGRLVMEFVPKDDSQVRRLLAARDDMFPDYNLDDCLKAFEVFFDKESVTPVSGSSRQMCVLTKK